MIRCPHCQTPYFVGDDIDRFGRMVRCAVCGTNWLARTFDDDPYHRPPRHQALALSHPADIVDAVVIEHIRPGFKPVHDRHDRAGPPRVVIGGRQKLRRLKAISAVLGVLVLAVVLRTTIVAALPDMSTTAAYAVGHDHLDLSLVRSETLHIGTARTLLVEGEIVNRSDKDVVLPAVRVSLEGDDGAEVYSWLVEPAASGLAPGKSIGFRSALASPPPGASRVTFDLASREERTVGLR